MKKTIMLLMLTFSLFSCVKRDYTTVNLDQQEARLTQHPWKGVSVSRFTGNHKISQHSLSDVSLQFYPDGHFVKNTGTHNSINGQWELLEQDGLTVLRIKYYDEDAGYNIIDDFTINILTNDHLEYTKTMHQHSGIEIRDNFFFEKN